jgi:hypothetical protein
MAIIRRLNSPLDARNIDLLIEAAGAKARDSFADFRRFLHPEMLWGWWTQDVADQLQQFYQRASASLSSIELHWRHRPSTANRQSLPISSPGSQGGTRR